MTIAAPVGAPVALGSDRTVRVARRRVPGAGRVRCYLIDVRAMAWRNITQLRRDPVSLVFVTVQPAVFVVLFTVVFGRSLELLVGVAYIQYLLPGIFAQTVLFGAMGTGVGVATDLQDGMVERFRTLPMAPSAVLVGRTLADLARNAWAALTMFVVGTALGFEIWGATLDFVAAMAVLLLLGYALGWVFVLLGLSGRPERVFGIAFPIIMPLVFVSSAMVPVAMLPDWVAGFARNQPVTAAIEAIRHVVLGDADHRYTAVAVGWALAITVVAAAASCWRFRRGS